MARFDGLILPASADMHVHLRDGDMMHTVVPTIRKGGVDTVFVMPNLVPPITTVSHAMEYKSRLQQLAPGVTLLMSLYLHSSITPEVIREAKAAGIAGVKCFPAGVTTNSASGVVDYESFYPIFRTMEEVDLVLNLHGEVPSNDEITVLNAEEAFLPTLLKLHERFPKLRIVLEHCTTAEAVECVKRCGDSIVGTITAHHLFLTVDDWAGDSINFCKPVAKTPRDRDALLKAAVSGKKFFMGSDSAPHPLKAKKGGENGMDKCLAGVFTQPHVTQLYLEAFESATEKGVLREHAVTEDILRGFLGEHGRRFYRVPESKERIRIRKGEEKITESLRVGQNDMLVPFRRGQPTYSIEWT